MMMAEKPLPVYDGKIAQVFAVVWTTHASRKQFQHGGVQGMRELHRALGFHVMRRNDSVCDCGFDEFLQFD